MRTNLVFTFQCAKCGAKLEMRDVLPPAAIPHYQVPPLPTGAEMLSPGVVLVDPCPGCVEPLRQAARDIQNGLGVLAL